jgi:hypothetical protein
VITAASQSHWYESGTFYAAAGAIAVVVIGAVTIWVTLRVGSIKRQLTYSMTDDTPLLATTTGLARADLEVLYQGQRLDAPRVISVRLASRGRRDIASGDFDQNRPLAIDVGVPIVKRLATESAPELPEAAVRVDGQRLIVGPCLIRKRQVISFSFLVDGGPPLLSHEDYLLNVDVRASAESGDPRLPGLAAMNAIAVAVLATAWLATTAGSPVDWLAVTLIALLVLVSGFELFWQGHRKPR